MTSSAPARTEPGRGRRHGGQRAGGSSLGTGAMIVISEGTSVVRKVSEYVEFFAANSCGQCPPCKSGTFQLARLIDRVDTGIATGDQAMRAKVIAGLSLVLWAATIIVGRLIAYLD